MTRQEENDYYGFHVVNIDNNGNYTYDQAALGNTDEEYIVMSREFDELFREERSRANIELGKLEDYEY